MTTKASLTTKPTDSFKQFPEFSKLELGDRMKYESLLKGYPPIADTKFYSLMIHWSARDVSTVSKLNGNLVISYWVAGLEKYSGLSVLGTSDVDQTVCTVFDHLRGRGDEVKLVHVPEFVVEHMEYPEMFQFEAERGFDEYILNLSKLCDLQSMASFRKRRIQRFRKAVGESRRIVVRQPDLADDQCSKEMKSKVSLWAKRGFINNLSRHVNETIDFAIDEAVQLGIESLALYVDGELHGYILYYPVNSKNMMLLTHAIVNDEYPCTYDFMVYAFSKWLVDHDINQVNLDSDLGIPLLRVIKMALRPDNFLRKYTVRPSGSSI